MCGIVGYVGSQSALDVVIAGLKRLEYRGYDSAGVAVLGRRRARRAPRRPGKLVNLEKELADRPLPAGTHRHRAHPVGHPRRRRPTPTPTRTSTTRAGSPSSTTGSSRTSPRCAPSWPSAGHELASETDTEVVAHLLAEEFSSCGDLAEAMRQVCRRLEGAFTLVAVHADEPDVVVGARRNSPLVVGRRRGRDLPRLGRRRVHRPHPRGDRAGPGPGRRAAPRRRRRSPTSTARPPRCASYHVDWDASAAEKGGYDYFMLKEIAEQPKAVADTLLGRIDAGGLADASTRCGSPTRSCARSTRSSSSPAVRPSTPG